MSDIFEIAKQISAELKSGNAYKTPHMIYQGFFRCICGKIHSYGGVSHNTKCTCGNRLWSHIK